jgi:hypothetical protein
LERGKPVESLSLGWAEEGMFTFLLSDTLSLNNYFLRNSKNKPVIVSIGVKGLIRLKHKPNSFVY